jgi:hypothetical protein
MVGGGGVVLRARHGRRLVDHQLGLQRAGQPASQHRHQRQPVHAVARGQQQRRERGGSRSSGGDHATVANRDAPVNTSSDIAQVWAGLRPAATDSTPKEMP